MRQTRIRMPVMVCAALQGSAHLSRRPLSKSKSGPGLCAHTRGLTLPSRGRPPAGFARLRPPLTSNVRPPMSIVVTPIAESHAEGFHACLDAVAREKKYLAQIEALPLERIQAFVRESVANSAAQFVALDGTTVVGWCDIFPEWAHAVQHCGTLGMGVL